MPVAATILDERACAGFPSIDHMYVHTHTASRFISHNHNQAKRCYVGLVAVGVQEQAGDILLLLLFDPGTQFAGNEKNYAMQYKKSTKIRLE